MRALRCDKVTLARLDSSYWKLFTPKPETWTSGCQSVDAGVADRQAGIIRLKSDNVCYRPSWLGG